MSWFSRFLDRGWTKVKYGETFSKHKQTKLGLPQGAVTSTTLFNAYIKDLPNTVRNTKINTGMYADDSHMDLNQEQYQTTQNLTANNKYCSELPKQVGDRKQYGNKCLQDGVSIFLHAPQKRQLRPENQQPEATKKRQYKIPRCTHG